MPDIDAGGDVAKSLQLPPLRKAYLSRAVLAMQLFDRVLTRIAEWDDPALWICRTSEMAVRKRARELDAQAAADPAVIERLPLFGIPFAVKDNIDVAGMATTAGCPAFAYRPARSARVVELLQAAGAVCLGKTNLDQFATGLVGTRSPYGVPRNPFNARFIPGGSSSGSAVAVSAGLVSFALGTDTAGSGRVPAAFNNIVGLKPSRGLLSTRGVVPACRSLDCVAVFALTAADASAVFDVAACFDPDDPLARRASSGKVVPGFVGTPFRFGVPPARDLNFFGNEEATRLFAAAVGTLEKAGGTRVEIGFAPFRDAGRLLYDGPWVAERLHATEALLRRNPEAMLPVTRSILEDAKRYSALDVYRAQYELAGLQRTVEGLFTAVDLLLLPTAGTIYEIAAIAAEPLRLNASLGLYTNFVNLLDLTAIAVPSGFREDGLPFGVSLIAPAFTDRALLKLATQYQKLADLPIGATGDRVTFRSAAPEC